MIAIIACAALAAAIEVYGVNAHDGQALDRYRVRAARFWVLVIMAVVAFGEFSQ